MSTATRESWGRLRQLVKKRDRSTCYHCGNIAEEDGQCDHLIPLSKGGTDSILNLVWSCKSCNAKKNNRVPEDNSELPAWLTNVETIPSKPTLNNVFSTFIYTLIAVLIPPYPQYSDLDFPSYSIYFERIAYLRLRITEDWLRGILWTTPPDAQYAIDALDRYERVCAKIIKYHNVSKDDFIYNVNCPDCGQPPRLLLMSPDGKHVKYLCSLGHSGKYSHFSLNESQLKLRQAAKEMAAYESGYGTLPFDPNTLPRAEMFILS